MHAGLFSANGSGIGWSPWPLVLPAQTFEVMRSTQKSKKKLRALDDGTGPRRIRGDEFSRKFQILFTIFQSARCDETEKRHIRKWVALLDEISTGLQAMLAMPEIEPENAVGDETNPDHQAAVALADEVLTNIKTWVDLMFESDPDDPDPQP